MTVPVVVLPLLHPEGPPAKKKRVLLLDTSQTKRDLRADVMRKLGIDVDCAADVIEARCWWRADLYNLVLINVSGENDRRDQFCADMRSANPPQRVAFFVGGPAYLAAAPHSDDAPAEADADALHKEMVAALAGSGFSKLIAAALGNPGSLQEDLQRPLGQRSSFARHPGNSQALAVGRSNRTAFRTRNHKPQPLFPAATAAIETATETATEREELL